MVNNLKLSQHFNTLRLACQRTLLNPQPHLPPPPHIYQKPLTSRGGARAFIALALRKNRDRRRRRDPPPPPTPATPPFYNSSLILIDGGKTRAFYFCARIRLMSNVVCQPINEKMYSPRISSPPLSPPPPTTLDSTVDLIVVVCIYKMEKAK